MTGTTQVQPDSGAFTVTQPAFTGTLGELGHALRSGSVQPSELDLLQLVREWLQHFNRLASLDLDVASMALPQVAQVIELKLRLLLPRPPRDDGGDVSQPTILEAVALLEELEGAIEFLRIRREDRRLLMPARTPRPDYVRQERPGGSSAGRLQELAARLRNNTYFELVRDSLSLQDAAVRLVDALSQRTDRRSSFLALTEGSSWPEQTVMFAALLELVRQGTVRASQAVPHGDILLALEG